MKDKTGYTFIHRWYNPRHYRLEAFLLVTITTLVIILFGFNGCTKSCGNAVVIPEYEGIGPPPIEVTVDQLFSEYMTDETSADAKYKGERLLFYEVEVEQVLGEDVCIDIGRGEWVYEKFFFISGSVQFGLRDFGIMQNMEEGFVLNVVGVCYGLLEGFVFIEDCWVESIVGDLGMSDGEDIY
jgi:hypothetical protein